MPQFWHIGSHTAVTAVGQDVVGEDEDSIPGALQSDKLPNCILMLHMQSLRVTLDVEWANTEGLGWMPLCDCDDYV